MVWQNIQLLEGIWKLPQNSKFINKLVGDKAILTKQITKKTPPYNTITLTGKTIGALSQTNNCHFLVLLFIKLMLIGHLINQN